MLTKKHLGPLACMSCEKNLINVQGMPVDYHNWKKLPFREPNERIARYAQGFSKMLSTMNPGSNELYPNGPSSQMVSAANLSPSYNAGLGGQRNSKHGHHQSWDETHLIAQYKQGGDFDAAHLTHSTMPSGQEYGSHGMGGSNFKTQIGFLKSSGPSLPKQPSSNYVDRLESDRKRHNSTLRQGQPNKDLSPTANYRGSKSPEPTNNGQMGGQFMMGSGANNGQSTGA